MSETKLTKLFLEAISTNPALAQRAANVTSAEELVAFAKAEGITVDYETAQRLLPKLQSLAADDGKLTDDALDSVAGGANLYLYYRGC